MFKKTKQRRTQTGGWVLAILSRAVWATAGMLSLDAASNLGGFIGRTLGMKLIKDRSIDRNLTVAFPKLSSVERDRLTAGIGDNIGRVIAEMPHLGAFRRGEKDTRIVIEGLENLPASGPSIFVGGHLSNWEVGVVALCRHLGCLNTLYSPIGVPTIDKQLQSFRAATGATYLERNGASLRTIFDGMEGGRSVAMLVDQRVATGPTVNFFGRPALASSLPARLAQRFNAPIIPVDGSRVSPRHFLIRLHTPIHPNGFPPDDLLSEHMTQAMMSAVEHFIRRSPEVWFCNKARWRESGTAIGARTDISLPVPGTILGV